MKPLSAYREEFPVAAEQVYFNHASTGPLPRRSAEAMKRVVDQQWTSGGGAFAEWTRGFADLRRAAARLIGAEESEIALTKNTSEGLSFIANGVDWRPGDEIVVVEDEFPANWFPWARLERRGVRLRRLSLRNGRLDLDDVDRACRGARLLAVSFVQYLSGFRLDLDAAGEICRRRGCRFVVDAVQGLGPFPVDVRRSGVHALSASGHKWLLGPEGAAILYVDRDWLPELDIVEFGWTNVVGFPSYSREERPRPDAGRLECGTLNTVGCAGLRGSIELFLEAGVERVAEQVTALGDRLLAGAVEKGFRPAAERPPADASGIISLRREGLDSTRTTAELGRQGISAAARHGWIRFSPHFYNSEDEVDRCLAALPS